MFSGLMSQPVYRHPRGAWRGVQTLGYRVGLDRIEPLGQLRIQR